MLTVAPIDINWHTGLSIFAAEPFLKAVGDRYGWIGGFTESGKLRCILPYTVVHKATLRMVRFRVETIPLDDQFGVAEERSFLNGVVKYFRAAGMDMIIPATTNTIFKTYPDGAVVAPYGTYVVDLNQPEDAVWSNLNTSHRRKVRQAGKQGVQIKSGMDQLEAVHALVRDTFKRSKLGFMGYPEFERYVRGLNEHVLVSVAEYQGVMQACVVVPFSEFCGYYVYGGSVDEPVTGATNMLHWETMRQLQGLGVKRYDFVGVRIDPDKGSKQEGLLQYKQRFGGQLVQGFMWKYPLRPFKSSAYSLAVRFLRGGDIVDQERHKTDRA
jgi:lipid II:glycine glycyltransferase (peptidoglycan interpeptide bridge formation enzyme)